MNKKHITLILFLVVLIGFISFRAYDVFAQIKYTKATCHNLTVELQNKARNLYKKDAEALSKISLKSVQGQKMKKDLDNKIDNYISKGLPAACKGNKMPGWKIGVRVFTMFFGL